MPSRQPRNQDSAASPKADTCSGQRLKSGHRQNRLPSNLPVTQAQGTFVQPNQPQPLAALRQSHQMRTSVIFAGGSCAVLSLGELVEINLKNSVCDEASNLVQSAGGPGQGWVELPCSEEVRGGRT